MVIVFYLPDIDSSLSLVCPCLSTLTIKSSTDRMPSLFFSYSDTKDWISKIKRLAIHMAARNLCRLLLPIQYMSFDSRSRYGTRYYPFSLEVRLDVEIFGLPSNRLRIFTRYIPRLSILPIDYYDLPLGLSGI